MIRLFICAALQVAFVTAYATWAATSYDAAIRMLPVFIAVAWGLIVYNNWRPIWAYVRTWRR